MTALRGDQSDLIVSIMLLKRSTFCLGTTGRKFGCRTFGTGLLRLKIFSVKMEKNGFPSRTVEHTDILSLIIGWCDRLESFRDIGGWKLSSAKY